MFFSQAGAVNPGLLGAAINPESNLLKTHLFPRQPDATQALSLEKKTASNTSGPVTRQEGKKIQITDKSNHIGVFSKTSRVLLCSEDGSRPESLFSVGGKMI